MFSVNFRGGIEVKQLVKIHLILEAKFRDEPLEDSITFLGALDVNDVVLVSLLLTSNRFHTFFKMFLLLILSMYLPVGVLFAFHELSMFATTVN